jgi:deoxyuridine 5'-triphosphate nucleotidohydrolase
VKTKELWPLTTEGQAYLLGLLAGSFKAFSGGVIELEPPGRGRRVLRLFQQLSTAEAWLDRGRVRIRSKHLEAEMLAAGLGMNETAWSLPAVEPALSNAFLRGLFDSAGHIPSFGETRELMCSLTVRPSLGEAIARRYTGAQLARLNTAATVTWTGTNALDLLGELYEGAKLYRKSHRRSYLSWAGSIPSAPTATGLRFQYRLMEPRAVAPFKSRVSDSGFDLTLIREVKRHGRCTLYGTGLQVRPPPGWYFDVVPRSSIIKTGYVAANSVGVIDRGYRGEILVPLIKIDPAAPDLNLPARVAQMIPRPIVHLIPEASDVLDTTERGEGGFGSTGP